MRNRPPIATGKTDKPHREFNRPAFAKATAGTAEVTEAQRQKLYKTHRAKIISETLRLPSPCHHFHCIKKALYLSDPCCEKLNPKA